jgi:hypothetical protein
VIENYDPCEKWYQKSWQLSSNCLFEKSGFADGDLFDDLCLDTEIHSWMPTPKELLKLVIVEFLLPKIGHEIELQTANGTHNPFRVESEYKDQFVEVEVTVTGEQIFEMLDKQQ